MKESKKLSIKLFILNSAHGVAQFVFIFSLFFLFFGPIFIGYNLLVPFFEINKYGFSFFCLIIILLLYFFIYRALPEWFFEILEVFTLELLPWLPNLIAIKIKETKYKYENFLAIEELYLNDKSELDKITSSKKLSNSISVPPKKHMRL